MKTLLAAGLMLAGLVSSPAAVSAQPTCTLPTEHLISWPTNSPIWQMCWVRPNSSSGARRSGLEIRNVYYNGHLVLKRAHTPITNVIYEGGNCGGAGHCYRDQTIEQAYLTDNVCPPPNTGTNCGYAEPTCPPITVCDMPTGTDVCTIGQPPPPPNPCGQSCFSGVSAQKLLDRLVLTTQIRAGWYRYDMKWTFYPDGRIEPFFGFAAVFDPCTNFTHRHNVYWRLDFDLDGADRDEVFEGPRGVGKGKIRTEAMRLNTDPSMYWEITDRITNRGYRIVPGDEIAQTPADAFAVGDFWVLKYKPEELDDNGQPGPACAIKINNYLNGETLDDDLVVWYRGGVRHLGRDLDHCHPLGPMLVPIGDWSPGAP